VLDAVADGKHGLLPARLSDIQAAQAKHFGYADIAFSIHIKGGHDYGLNLRARVLTPFAQQFFEDVPRDLQPLVKGDALLDGNLDFAAPIKGGQGNIPLRTTDIFAVLLGRQLNES